VRQPPLAGVRVVDFTRMLAGPFCTQQLADLGADVIKVELPGTGDDSRRPTPGAKAGASSLFLSANRNKRSVALNLKTEAGRDAAAQLCAEADVVVENFANGVMSRLGLDYEDVSSANPKLIYCSISGFGRDDSSSRRAYDGVLQAASGLMSLTGMPDGPPLRTAVPIVDTAAASAATTAVLAALIARERDGCGQLLEVALMDVAVSLLTTYASAAVLTDSDATRYGNRSAQSAPSDVYPTSDGWISITCGNDRLFAKLAAALGRPGLADDVAYADTGARLGNSETLSRELSDVLLGESTSYWMAEFDRAGVPAAPVRTVRQALASEDVRRRSLLTHLPHPRYGTVPDIAPPFRLSATPTVAPVVAPDVGEHTEQVLRLVLGWDDGDLDRARDGGAFGSIRHNDKESAR
jgi:crotonobetainyl-CoA:carnitine CoA-transferase CaiB-like acyl-CoA transferase